MLTVVIPALNAEAALEGTVASVTNADEIVVVDGGSSDATPVLAARLGARVVAAPRGRGPQLAAGVAAARGEWLLLLHADTRLASGWREARLDPDRAGYFRFTLDSDDPRARRLEWLVAWRCRVLALPYGDQGLLIHRDLLAAVWHPGDGAVCDDRRHMCVESKAKSRNTSQFIAPAITPKFRRPAGVHSSELNCRSSCERARHDGAIGQPHPDDWRFRRPHPSLHQGW